MDGSSHQIIVADAPRPAAATATRPATAALPMLEFTRPRLLQRLIHPFCLAIAAAAHLGLAALTLASRPDEFGESGSALEAIAVDVIEVMPSDASVSAVESDGAAGEPAPELAETPPEPKESPTEIARNEPSAGPARTDAAVLPPPPQPSHRPEPVVERDTPPPPEEPRPASPAAPPQSASVAAVASGEASQGVVNAYGAALSRIISQGRPKGRDSRNLKGTVVVEFVVSSSGQLERADVKASSGNPRLDDLGVAALRKLQLPAPAPEMTLRQRTFTVPFVYR